jgi:hypothetical protein
MNTRPMGVIVLSMLAVVTGFVSVVSALALMGVAQFGFLKGAAASGSVLTIFGVADLIVGISAFVLAFGFWYSRNWSWSLGFAVYGIALVISVITAALGIMSIGSVIVIAAVSVLTIWYLMQPQIKSTLGH